MTTRLRWLGVAGTVLLAVAGYLAGARPGPAPASQAEALWGTGVSFRLGLAAYLAGLVLLGWAWWRLGAVLRAGTPPVGLRWLLVTGALWAVPLLAAPPLGSRDVYAYACQGALWLDGHDPYQVGAAVGGCPWLAAVPQLWHDSTTPYGPVALAVSAAAVALARAAAGGADGQLLVAVGVLRSAAVAGAVLVAAGLPRLARACGVDPAAATWLGLVTPLVALHVVAGAHNDALVAGLLVAALALAAPAPPIKEKPIKEKSSSDDLQSRQFLLDRLLLDRRGLGAGVAVGLAVAVKVTAVAALPFAVLLAAGGRRWRGAAAVGVGALVGFAGATVATRLGTGWAGGLTGTGALAQWSSPPTGLGMAAGYVLRGFGVPDGYDSAVAVARVLGLAALVALSAVVLVRAARRAGEPRAVVAGAGTVLAAVVLLGPVVYPWYAVVPLAVLAAAVPEPRWGVRLAVATLVLAALVLPSGLGVPVLTKFPGAMLVALAAVLVSWWWLRRRRARSRPAGRTGAAGPPPEHPDPPRAPPAPVR